MVILIELSLTRLLILLVPIIFLEIVVINIQQTQAITQFYFDMPDDFELSKYSTFKAQYFDEDGEGTWFMWNYTGIPYDFKVDSDCCSIDRHNETKSVLPLGEPLLDIRYDFRFAISDNLTIGENIELCVDSTNFDECEWPQPIDQFGRALADLSVDEATNMTTEIPRSLFQPLGAEALEKSPTNNNGILIGARILDPNSGLLDVEGHLKNNVNLAANNDLGYSRNGTIADGVSKLILILNSSNTLLFSIADTNPNNLTKGTLTSFSQSLNSNSLSSTTIVHPQRISDDDENRSVAIVVYTPPNFIELPKDTSFATINILVNDTRYQPTPVALYRVPIVLVHGLWGNPQETWINSKFNQTLEESGFDVFFADYSAHNAETFDPYNISEIGNHGINSIRKAITQVNEEYSNKSLAATQVDVIAHSMGGLMARGLVQQPDYKTPQNFMKGSIHRLITIGTPHFGGDLSRILFEHRDQKYCVYGERLLPVDKSGNCNEGKLLIDLKKIFEPYRSIVQGGVQSLIPESDAYAHLCQTDVKSYAIAGIWKPNATFSQNKHENFYKDVTGDTNFSLDNDGFRDQNDLLVSLSSQLGGLMHNQSQSVETDFVPHNSKVYSNTLHTTSYIQGNDKNISSEINSAEIQQDVVRLLGSSNEDKKFADAIGIGSLCDIPK